MIRILIITLIFLLNFSYAKNLEGKIIYTEETARIEAFRDIARKIPKSMFKEHLKDRYFKENYANLKNKNFIISSYPQRNINPFYKFNKLVLYSVQYDDDINKKYYYNILGHLVKYEINDYCDNYPYRAIAYSKKGEVINITLAVSENEAFIFDKNEKLLGHWFEEQFYDNNGKKGFNRDLE